MDFGVLAAEGEPVLLVAGDEEDVGFVLGGHIGLYLRNWMENGCEAGLYGEKRVSNMPFCLNCL